MPTSPKTGPSLVILSLVFGLAPGAHADTTRVAIQDSFLKSGQSDENEGANPLLRISRSGHNRTVLTFNLGGIDPATVTSARLELTLVESSGWQGGRPVDVHVLDEMWVEGNGWNDGNAVTGAGAGVTWNCALDGDITNASADCESPWDGGGFDGAAVASVVHTDGMTGVVSFDVTSAMAPGATEISFIVKKRDENTNGDAAYRSKEGAFTLGEPQTAPRLVLIGPPNQPPTATDEIALAHTGETILVDVLANDTDPNGDALTLVSVEAPAIIVDNRVEVSFSTPGIYPLQYTIADVDADPLTDTATLHVGVGSGTSTMLIPYADSYLGANQPDSNDGASDVLRVTSNTRSVLGFDLTGVDIRRVYRASLELNVASANRWGGSGRPVDAHRLLMPFTEGTGSSGSGVTWNCAVDSDISNKAPDCAPQWRGGMYDPSVSASVTHTNSTAGVVSWDVTADIASLGTAASEVGFLLKKRDEGVNGDVEYDSKSSGGVAPSLVLEIMNLPETLPDIVPPTITAPANVTVAAVNANGTPLSAPAVAAFLSGASVTDDLDPSPSVATDAPDPLPIGTTTVTFYATDDGGNTATATAQITVEDQTAPVVMAPMSIRVNSPDGTPVPVTDLEIATFLLSASAVDNVDGPLATSHDAPDQFSPDTTTSITFFATDSSGLTGMASATVMVTQILVTATPLSGQNINMVSGLSFIDGDPFLQRQNEPSLAASTRNPMHLLGGTNDYRTVDLPGLPDGKVTGDAWLGVFKSFDGGQRWVSTLLPGFPQDTSPEGILSPLEGYEAAADPVVRAGAGGIFFYSGLVFDRGTPAKSRIFVARYVDNNNDEVADTIRYVDTGVVDSRDGSLDVFLDKPWMAVDIPRAGATTCSVNVPGSMETQTFPGGNVYITYAAIANGGTPAESSLLYFSRSTDCGVTWSSPVVLSQAGDTKNQGATIAIDPATGNLYIAWRRFATATGETNAVLIRRSMDGGQSFDPAVVVAELTTPFDQQTVDRRDLDFYQFRTNSYPTMTIDSDGRIYLALAAKNFSTTPTPDSRIVITTSMNGTSFTPLRPVDNEPNPGHQMMPTLAFAAGKLFLSYYDFRDDISGSFDAFVRDFPLIPDRHTVDVRTALALPADEPVFTIDSATNRLPSTRVSKYDGFFNNDLNGFEQQEFNFPNLPLFREGTAPFLGDYIDVAPTPPFVPVGDGTWTYNTDPGEAPVFQLAWADNRDVIPPADGRWDLYIAPFSDASMGSSEFCSADNFQRAGMRDQNVYTAQVSEGLYVGVPFNTKPLVNEFGESVQRAFVIYIQNATDELRSYRMSIANQPPDAFPVGPVGRATFKQFPLPPYDATSEPPVTQLLVLIPPRSSVARTVFVTSEEPLATIRVDVFETGIPGTTFVPSLRRSVLLNPDLLNPDLLNPDLLNRETHNVIISDATISNPDLLNPDLLNPDLLNPDLLNPDLLNPDMLNPDLLNPDLLNPDLLNPDMLNPDLINPDLLNPDLLNPDLLNTSLTDMTWRIQNVGNTTTTYSFHGFLDEAPAKAFKYQLLIYRSYKTPMVDENCNLVEREVHELIANITGIRNPDLLNPDLLNPDLLNPDLLNPDLLNPDLLNPDLLNPDLLNPDLLNAAIADGSFFLQPSDEVLVTLRILDTDVNDGVDFEPETVTPVVVSSTANTEDAEEGFDQPPVASPTESPLSIFTTELRQGAIDVEYRATLVALGADNPVTWTVVGLPTGLTYDPLTGQVFGVPATTGSFLLAVTADDGADVVSKNVSLEITTYQLRFTTQPVGVDAGATLPPVTVTVFDAAGNPVTGVMEDITLSIGNNPGGGTLSGVTTTQAIGGVATFSMLSIDKAGSGYTLLATGPGLKSALSSRFDVAGTTASTLAFTINPASTTPLAPFSAQVVVQDALGNVRTDATDAIMLALGANPGGGTLFGPMMVNAVNGVANFSGLGIDQAGTGYTLTASAAGLTGAVSSPFDINVTPPAMLAFRTQPSNAEAGLPIAPSVEVEIRDGTGTLVPTATNLVTLGFYANPFGGTLFGATTVEAVNGVATFPNLSVDRAGAGYVLGAFSAGLTPDVSLPFAITPTSPDHLVLVDGDNQTAPIGATLAVDPTVRVEDVFNNPVFGVAVDFAVTAGGGSVNPGTELTDASGISTTEWTLGTTPGTDNNTVEASVSGLTPITFSASATALGGRLTFDAVVHTGSLTYDGLGGPATGVSIGFDVIASVGTPLNPGTALSCVSCELNFVTGPNVTEGPNYQWAEGGTFQITGSIPALGFGPGVIAQGDFTTANLNAPSLGVFSAIGAYGLAMELVEHFYGTFASPPDVEFTVAVIGTISIGPDEDFSLTVTNADVAGEIPPALLGIMGALAGGGPNAVSSTNAAFRPRMVARDNDGNALFSSEERVFTATGLIAAEAGDGIPGFSGELGPALEASIAPYGVARDAAGDLYIADFGNHRIRKVSGGDVSTVAGTGTPGFSGDDGLAILAELNEPWGITVDTDGTIYFADRGNHRVRQISPAGIITTYAGSGSPGFNGDGAALSSQLNSPVDVALDGLGGLYIADRDNQRVRLVTGGNVVTVAGTGGSGFGGDGGPATSATLSSPAGIDFDSGILYIADAANHRIRAVDGLGEINTIAGNGTPAFSGDGGPATIASLSDPTDVAAGGSGNLFIADQGNLRIREIDTLGDITTLAGNGEERFSGDGEAAEGARLNFPYGVAVDAAGNVYFSDQSNQRIRRVDATTRVITTVAGSGNTGFGGDGGPATSADLNFPFGVAIDNSGNIYFADELNHRVRRIDALTGDVSTFAGNGTGTFGGDGGPATAASLNQPRGIAFDAAGNLLIADFGNHRIRQVDTLGDISTFAGTGTPGYNGDSQSPLTAQLNAPWDVWADPTGPVYVADSGNNRVRQIDGGLIITVAGDGTPGFGGDGSLATSAQLTLPTGVVTDADGNLFISDFFNRRVRMVTTTNRIFTVVGTGVEAYRGDGMLAREAALRGPVGLAIDADGNLIVADTNNTRVRIIVIP